MFLHLKMPIFLNYVNTDKFGLPKGMGKNTLDKF